MQHARRWKQGGEARPRTTSHDLAAWPRGRRPKGAGPLSRVPAAEPATADARLVGLLAPQLSLPLASSRLLRFGPQADSRPRAEPGTAPWDARRRRQACLCNAAAFRRRRAVALPCEVSRVEQFAAEATALKQETGCALIGWCVCVHMETEVRIRMRFLMRLSACAWVG